MRYKLFVAGSKEIFFSSIFKKTIILQQHFITLRMDILGHMLQNIARAIEQ